MFAGIPGRYELINHVLTLGLDRSWRKRAARMARRQGGTRWLDVCSGTGDMARTLAGMAGNEIIVHAIDFSLPMIGRLARNQPAPVVCCLGNARSLPYAPESFDLVTVSFATRNLNVTQDNLLESFREFYRVLKPGGLYLNLETSQPDNRLVSFFFRLYIKVTVRSLGRLISGSDRAYSYLAETIPRFYTRAELTGLLRQSGFEHVEATRLLLGAVAIHQAGKQKGTDQ